MRRIAWCMEGLGFPSIHNEITKKNKHIMESKDAVKCAIDQLGQALSDADRHDGIICKERIQYAMRLLMDQEEPEPIIAGVDFTDSLELLNKLNENNYGF